MNKYYPLITSVLLISLVYFLHPFYVVCAHTGGGPPFLEVNGKYAQTNVYYLGNASINIPQDNGPDTYLANKPISFIIDTKQLLIPPEIIAQSTFRWNFDYDNAKKNYEYGTNLTHTYTIPKTYLVTLEVKAPGETDYTLIDTVNINALPFPGYQLPRPSIAVETDHLQANKMVVFKGTARYDAHAKFSYLAWDLGDGTTSHDWVTYHTYHNLSDYENHVVIMRVIDSNQFVSDAEVILKSNSGHLVFIDGNGNKASLPVSLTYDMLNKPPKKGMGIIYPEVGVLIAIVVIIASVFLFRRKKK